MRIWRSEAEVVVMEDLQEEIMRRPFGVGDATKLGPDGIRRKRDAGAALCEEERREVCVTGGISFVGSAIVQRLLRRGYVVRLLVETQEDMDKLGKVRYTGVRPVMVRIMDTESLCQAFDGCAGVFHTSSSLDPGGISGYSKQMVNMEVRAVEQVIEACVRTESVRKCVFTSSLAACIWRQSDRHGRQQRPSVVDESCWSDESLCRDKKLWFALGKTTAEKAAWEAARRSNLHFVTVCSALVTGSEFYQRNSTGSIAYLKRAHEMFAEGLLATVELEMVADAHVSVYEAAVASGRYICYDHIVQRSEEIKELERQLSVPVSLARKSNTTSISLASGLSNRKLFQLMNSGRKCTYEAHSSLS